MAKTKVLHFRVQDSLFNAVDQISKEVGMTRSQLCVYLIANGITGFQTMLKNADNPDFIASLLKIEKEFGGGAE